MALQPGATEQPLTTLLEEGRHGCQRQCQQMHLFGLQEPASIYDINREQDYVKNSGCILGENELRTPSQLHSLLEKTETGFISEKIFETVSLSSDSVFQKAVSILHTSYLDSASEHGFQYSQVTLVKNDIFLNEYKTFYQEKKASNYTQEELQETYGFLLFETENQAKLVCQRGLCIGSSAISTLGDPAKATAPGKCLVTVERH
uniref:Transcription activation suppressor family member 2 n=1 Tax=Rousettus aegyptiacus TaxID=9407 RepID=A0A7J8EBM7_ROUAE|nr:transcription activation suppressor family member 2 [Rousettus aegyptiacus]